MTVALFIDTYFPQLNGVASVVSQLKLDLEAAGHTVWVITPRRHNSQELPNVHYLKAHRSTLVPSEYLATESSESVARFCADKHVDILHCHSEFTCMIIAIKVAAKLNLPLVFTFHTFWEYYISSFIWFSFLIPKHLAVTSYIRHFYKSADAIVAVSKKAEEYLLSAGIPREKLFLVENAIDRSTLVPAPIPATRVKDLKLQLGIDDNSFVFLYVGRVSNEKRLKELLSMFVQVKKTTGDKAKLIIVGDGPAKKSLQKRSVKLGIDKQVVFTGFVQRDDLAKYFAIADLFVSASVSETYSMTVTESLAANVPVLLRYDSCYFDRVVDGVNGIMAKTDEDFERAMIECVRTGNCARFKPSNTAIPSITSKEQAEKYLQIYEKLLTAGRQKIRK